MKNLKLVDGLNMLEKEEWISFRKYILMYCNKSSDNYRLLDYLYSIRSDLAGLEDIETVKKPLFEKMGSKNFSNLMSRIFNWYEEWLIWNTNKKEKIACDVQLVKIYNRRGQFNLANKTYRRVEKNILKEDQLDLERHKNLYQLHHNLFVSDNPMKYKRHEEILESLISFFLLQFKEQSFLYVAELHNWGVIQNHDYTKELEILAEIGTLIKDSETSRVIELIIRLVSELDEKAFLELRDVILGNQLKQGSELYVLSTFYMIAFSMRLWNINKISDPQIVLDAYDFGLQSGVLLSTGKIPIVRFINMVDTLSHIKNSIKTYDFVDKWIHIVDTKNPDSIRSLSYAQLKFKEGKYEDIIPLLVGKKFTADAVKLRASSFELISLYYDRQSNYSLLMNRLNNFRRVLKTFSSDRSNFSFRSYINFIKVLDLLIKRDFIKLTINIENYSPIMHKKWLISEIKAGHK